MANLRVAMLLGPLLAAPIAACAQEPDTVVSVGDRVRLMTTIMAFPVEGNILVMDEAAVVLAWGDWHYFRAPRAEILGAEVRVGKGPRHVVEGVLIGAVALGGLGFAFDVDPNDCGASSDNFCSRGEAVVSGTLGGALIGGLLGLVRGDRWAPATLEASPSAFLPGRVDLGVAVALGLERRTTSGSR